MYPIARNKIELLKYMKENIECRLHKDYSGINFISKNLKFIPDWFGYIVNKPDGTQFQVQQLLLGYNQLTTLPDSIGNFRFLKQLSIQNNQLTHIPDTIGNLSALEILNLQRNKLISVPNTIGSLTNLEELYMSVNRLTMLPDTITELQNLRRLEVYKNNLLYLPLNMAQLGGLNTINIIDNYIDDDNLNILRSMNIRFKRILPQKRFIWPDYYGMGGVKDLENEGDLYLGQDHRVGEIEFMWQVNRWEQEFNPKGKKNISSVQK